MLVDVELVLLLELYDLVALDLLVEALELEGLVELEVLVLVVALDELVLALELEVEGFVVDELLPDEPHPATPTNTKPAIPREARMGIRKRMRPFCVATSKFCADICVVRPPF